MSDFCEHTETPPCVRGRHWFGMIGWVSAPGTWGLPENLCVFSVHHL